MLLDFNAYTLLQNHKMICLLDQYLYENRRDRNQFYRHSYLRPCVMLCVHSATLDDLQLFGASLYGGLSERKFIFRNP